jgi:hypothetical protein
VVPVGVPFTHRRIIYVHTSWFSLLGSCSLFGFVAHRDC